MSQKKKSCYIQPLKAGADGKNGVNGIPGIPGAPGRAGNVGISGTPGTPGIPGTIGPVGPPGPSSSLSNIVASSMLPISDPLANILPNDALFPFTNLDLANSSVANFNSPGWSLHAGTYFMTINIQIAYQQDTPSVDFGAWITLVDRTNNVPIPDIFNIPPLAAATGVRCFNVVWNTRVEITETPTIVGVQFKSSVPMQAPSIVLAQTTSTTARIGTWIIEKLS